MIASYMGKQFPLPPQITVLTEDYLGLRPNDTLAEHFYVCILVHALAAEKSDYESCKEIIRAHEEEVHKLLPYKHVPTERDVLRHSYYLLGAMYTSTDQGVRAIEAFEKCYELDVNSIDAIYAIAFKYMTN